MKFLGYEFRKQEKELRSVFDGGNFNYFYGNADSSINYKSKPLMLSTVYRAINLISDSIALLQMKVYEVDSEGFKTEFKSNPLFQILGTEPNYKISRFTFFKLIISSLFLAGNAYIYINRDEKFQVKSLEFLNPAKVKQEKIKDEIKYSVSGLNGYLNDSDVIHILNYPEFSPTTGLINGISTIQYAYNSIELSHVTEQHAGNWFKGGSRSNTLITTSGHLTPDQTTAITNGIKSSAQSNGISLLSDIKDINTLKMSVSPKDSQLLEVRAFNAISVAQWFSVDPILLFSQPGTYANNETAQLAFLTQTLSPIIEKLENEFSRKLVYPSQREKIQISFDLSNLLRCDQNSMATYLTLLFDRGVLSANDIARTLNLPKIQGENGSEHFISTNLQKINDMIVNQKNSIDNKLL
jgi:HK97 family phage portal protein